MKEEIYAAVTFILKLIKLNSNLNEEQLKTFEKSLTGQLFRKFHSHWHPNKPWQGQGYRCLRVNETNGQEPTIAKAAIDSGVKYSDLRLPLELTVWVDPDEVCCRFGEHKGSYCTIASFHEGSKEDFIDRIDISELLSSENMKESEDNSKSVVDPKASSPRFFKNFVTSSKENISPRTKKISSPPKAVSVSPPNVLSPSQICNRTSGRLMNASSPPFFYSEQQLSSPETFHNSSSNLYSQGKGFPYYKPTSWGVPATSPVSPSQALYNSSAYFNYSTPPSPFSSQDNFNLNRISPPISSSNNRLRWKSGPVMDANGNGFFRNERHSWFYPRQLTRV